MSALRPFRPGDRVALGPLDAVVSTVRGVGSRQVLSITTTDDRVMFVTIQLEPGGGQPLDEPVPMDDALALARAIVVGHQVLRPVSTQVSMLAGALLAATGERG
jgi:hypothetical protein